MSDTFITKIFIEESRNIKDFEIPISEETRQHLILTGKNGSGKTSLLLEVSKFFMYINEIDTIDSYQDYINQQKEALLYPNLEENLKFEYESNIKRFEDTLQKFGKTKIEFSRPYSTIKRKYTNGEFIVAFFDSKRHSSLIVPQGINKIELQNNYSLSDRANQNFIQYIVNLKADRSFAKDDGESDVADSIDEWFLNFEKRLKHIFSVEDLELKFDRKTYNFKIITENRDPFSFDTLSDGYSAIISIVSELLLRMEAKGSKSYDIEGIVIIDEIETHLHVDLQKKILPFLIDFFPRIQFIITTHSPFVLSSVSNATICDLETKIITNDLSSYSYDALLESYFYTDKYSDIIKNKIQKFEELVKKPDRIPEENDELRNLRNYFAHAPKYLSDELIVKLQQLQLIELNNKNK